MSTAPTIAQNRRRESMRIILTLAVALAAVLALVAFTLLVAVITGAVLWFVILAGSEHNWPLAIGTAILDGLICAALWWFDLSCWKELILAFHHYDKVIRRSQPATSKVAPPHTAAHPENNQIAPLHWWTDTPSREELRQTNRK